jgi:hypothetical protein
VHELFPRHVAGAPGGLRRAENSGVSKATRAPLAESRAMKSMPSFALSSFTARTYRPWVIRPLPVSGPKSSVRTPPYSKAASSLMMPVAFARGARQPPPPKMFDEIRNGAISAADERKHFRRSEASASDVGLKESWCANRIRTCDPVITKREFVAFAQLTPSRSS